MILWMKNLWHRFKAVVVGVLTGLGFFTVAVLAPGDITYTRATQYEDGQPLPLEEIAETRLYCDNQVVLWSKHLVASEPGADEIFDAAINSLPGGDNICYGTHVSVKGVESDYSVGRLFRVPLDIKPGAPTLTNGETIPP